MSPEPGDHLVIADAAGRFARRATVVDALGEGGAPPFLVRWDAEGADAAPSVVYPSRWTICIPAGHPGADAAAGDGDRR